MTVGSILTLSRSSIPGTFLMVGTAPASATGFHSSPVLGWISQLVRNGAPMIFCNWGLTVVGTWIVLAGTCSPAGGAVWADAPAVAKTENRVMQPATKAWSSRCGDFFMGRFSRFIFSILWCLVEPSCS